jgi:uncharacterized membrane protein YkvI
MDLNKLWAGIAIFAMLVWLARAAYSAARRGDTRRGRIAGLFMIAFSLLAMLAFLFVISTRVPSSEKDGMFGAAGGLVMGAIIFSLASSAELMGRLSGNPSPPSSRKPE